MAALRWNQAPKASHHEPPSKEVPVQPRWMTRAVCSARVLIDGAGPGWRTLGENDFAPVNGNPDTWTWKDGQLFCSGKPIGVMRTRQKFTNFEMVVEWRMMRAAGNSGVFVWVPDEALAGLKRSEEHTS